MVRPQETTSPSSGRGGHGESPQSEERPRSDRSVHRQSAAACSEEHPFTSARDPTSLIISALDRFPRVARHLRDRPQRRTALTLDDEYDVQYVLGALLSSLFDDVRPEEWTPSHAGKSSRLDFFLKDEHVVVENQVRQARPLRSRDRG
jgi:hypothetical protein